MYNNRRFSLAPMMWLCFTAACSASGDRPTGDVVTSVGDKTLEIQPSDFKLVLRDGAPSFVDYSAAFRSVDGATYGVTAETTFSVTDEFVGHFVGARFQASGMPGKTITKALSRGKTAETTLSITVENIFMTMGVPADAPNKFGGTNDPARAPAIVYPENGVLLPPNMSSMEFHFMPGDNNDIFELEFSSNWVTAKVYFTCSSLGAGCSFMPNDEIWKFIAEMGRGKDPLEYTLRGTNSAASTTVGMSASQKVNFAQDDIVGGIYYWNAGLGAILRYEFGVSGQTPEMYMNAAKAGATQCVGCHQLSRDGSRIAVGLDVPAPAVLKVYDTTTKLPYFQQGTTANGGGANFFSFFPDNKQIATSNGTWIDVRNSDTGALIIDKLVPNGTMPDVSPDGKKLVYARPIVPSPCVGNLCSSTSVTQGAIDEIRYENGAWGAPNAIVPFEGSNNFYPSFAPDGSFIIFNRSGSLDSFEAKMAELWVTTDKTNAKPIKLANASQGGDVWPKWAPNIYGWRSGSLMWFTFSSRRPYGLHSNVGEHSQIWMAAFDIARAHAGEDASFPAFWLPFQDPSSGNHIAQWVLNVARRPCADSTDCEAGEACNNGICFPILK